MCTTWGGTGVSLSAKGQTANTYFPAQSLSRLFTEGFLRNVDVRGDIVDWIGEEKSARVAEGDVVLVPRGHCSCGAPYGYEMYYLNVMAGLLRK